MSIDEAHRLRIKFPEDGVTLGSFVSSIEPGLYRLEEGTAGCVEATYGDIVALREQGDGISVFEGIVTPSGLKRYFYLLSAERIAMPACQALLAEVMHQGGYWQQDFGGMLDIYLPSNATLDVETVVESLTARGGIDMGIGQTYTDDIDKLA